MIFSDERVFRATAAAAFFISGGSGRETQYIPTGRNRSRPRGSMNRPRGFSC